MFTYDSGLARKPNRKRHVLHKPEDVSLIPGTTHMQKKRTDSVRLFPVHICTTVLMDHSHVTHTHNHIQSLKECKL